MPMKRLLTYLFVFMALQVPAQNMARLDADNGLLGYTILTDLDTVPGFVSIFQDPDVETGRFDYAMIGSQYTYAGTEKLSFAGVPATKVFLTTVSVYISEIKIVFPFDSAVIRALHERYGDPSVDCANVKEFEEKKACWSYCIWQGRDVRLVMTSKFYYDEKMRKEAEVPEYIFLKYTSLRGESLPKRF